MKHSYTVCLPCAVIDEAKAEGTEKLLDEKPLQIMLVENSITTIGDGGHVILDFGREIAGGIRILFIKLRLRLKCGFGWANRWANAAPSLEKRIVKTRTLTAI